MGRRPNPERRVEVLDAVVDYLLQHGVHQMALRSLAAELDTSTYTFVYHFGSKDGMITEALDRALERDQVEFERLDAAGGDTASRLGAYWDWRLAGSGEATVRLLVDAVSLARVDADVYQPFITKFTDASRSFLAGQVEAGGRTAEQAAVDAAALAPALLGLHLEYLASGDRAQADTGLRSVMERIEALQPC